MASVKFALLPVVLLSKFLKMGNACATTEERDVDFDVNMKKEGSEFPVPSVATKQEKMNDVAPKAVPKYKNIGDYKLREVATTESYPIGGVYRYLDNEATYQGQYKSQFRNGLGVLITKDGQVYSGNWANDYRNGKGHAFYTNGDYYQGQFHDNNKHGLGNYFEENGTKYEGEWKVGKRDGQGVETTQDAVYTGGWQKDLKHGQGKWVFKSGGVYDGKFDLG